MHKKIYCVGGTALDRKLKAISPLVFATSNPISTSTHFGGVARNVAENLMNWTQGVYLHTVVGEDDDGVLMLSNMKQKGVDISHSLILKTARTANYFAVLNPDGELHMSLSDMRIFDQVPLVRFTQGFYHWEPNQLVFIDTNLSAEIIASAIAAAREKKIKIFIDPVSVGKTTKIPRDLTGIYLIKPNPLEAGAMTGSSVETVGEAMRAGETLLKMGAENVVITLGKAGYVIVNADMQEFVCIDPIHDVIDANGAGDAFMAGILYGVQQNFSLHQACQWGAAAAAFTVSSADTVAAGLTATKLQAFIHNQKIITSSHEEIF